MAWFDPLALTCPDCGRSGEVMFLCGVPLTPEGRAKSAGYVRIKEDGGWKVTKSQTHYVVSCPDCGAEVDQRSLNPKG